VREVLRNRREQLGLAASPSKNRREDVPS
jgi:hypothetical protein